MEVRATKRNMLTAIVLLTGMMAVLEVLVFSKIAKIVSMAVLRYASDTCACGIAAGTGQGWQQGMLLGLGILFAGGIAAGTLYALRTLIKTRRLVKRVMKESSVLTDWADGADGAYSYRGGRCEAFTFGFLKPRIAVCAHCAQEVSPSQLQAMIAHEKRHVAARDPLRFFILDTLKWTLFFVPLLRVSISWYHMISELQADEGVTDREALGGALLRMVEQHTKYRSPSGYAVSSFASALTLRIERLVNPGWKIQMHLRAVPMLGLLLVMVAAFGALKGASLPQNSTSSCVYQMRSCARGFDAAPTIYYNSTH